MNKDEMANGIRRVWLMAKAIGISQTFSSPSALEASAEFKLIATDSTSSYEALYLAGLRYSDYNVLLSDFSYLQFGFGKVDGVRYAYYPNPFINTSQERISELSEIQEYVTEGIISVEEFLHRASEIRDAQHPPLVRYEYSKSQYENLIHPCSHLHLGFHSDNRWAVRRELTPTAFSLLVFRLFYLQSWQKAGRVKEHGGDKSLDEIFFAAKQSCRLLYDDEFSLEEEKLFYLG